MQRSPLPRGALHALIVHHSCLIGLTRPGLPPSWETLGRVGSPEFVPKPFEACAGPGSRERGRLRMAGGSCESKGGERRAC